MGRSGKVGYTTRVRASSSPRERSPPAPSSSARNDARVRLRRRRFARASRGDAHRERRVAERVTVRPRPEELLSRQGRALVVHRDDLRALALHGTHPGGEVLHRRRHLRETERVSIARARKKNSLSRTTETRNRVMQVRFGRARPKPRWKSPSASLRGENQARAAAGFSIGNFSASVKL